MANQRLATAGTLTIGGIEYLVIPKAEYLRIQKSDVALPPGTVDAHSYAQGSIARGLREAREHAGLTQTELAERMGKSQTLISQAESGTARVSERYVALVLKACRLPKNWAGTGPARTKRGGKR